MAKFIQGRFIPKHPEKYLGDPAKISYRSSWELCFQNFLDSGHPNILGWSSETISIPYYNPVLQKWSMYIPDFFVIYMDKNDTKHVEMIEIKPEKEMPGFLGNSNVRTKLVQAVNAAKWQAALVYCAKRSWYFRVMTENQLFGLAGKGVQK